ncbi:glycoside hydrolase family 13 protein [Mycena rebaudengoi]|nr:glycoside hydrolase family 13 protein [Mycena rebaudengoi]
MGFTQVWLPPPNKATNQNGRGYDGYDLFDLGEFYQKGTVKTRWGTREELLQALQNILIDAVLNHKLGADRFESFLAVPVNPQNRLKDEGPLREIDVWTAFDFKGRGGKYSSFRWTHEHFTGLDWDHRTRKGGIYRMAGKKLVDSELGNYDYLLGVDIDHRHPDVREDLFKWGAWVLETTGATGFRLDAIKHIDHRFLRDFVGSISKRRCKMYRFNSDTTYSGTLTKPPNVCLSQNTGLETLNWFCHTSGHFETAFFDVPVHMNFHQASILRERYDLRTILNNTVVKAKPKDAVTFVKGQSLESWVENGFKIHSYAIILLRQDGHPCVFYGDLYPNEECYDERISRDLTLIIEARKKFAHGPCVDYFQERNCIGFVRKGDSKHLGCAVLLSNKEEADNYVHTIRMFVGRSQAGSVFRSVMSQQGHIDIDVDGWGDFSCPAGSVEVWFKS